MAVTDLPTMISCGAGVDPGACVEIRMDGMVGALQRELKRGGDTRIAAESKSSGVDQFGGGLTGRRFWNFGV
jgi:hypothetical protein